MARPSHLNTGEQYKEQQFYYTTLQIYISNQHLKTFVFYWKNRKKKSDNDLDSPSLSHVTCPVVLYWGANDWLTQPQVALLVHNHTDTTRFQLILPDRSQNPPNFKVVREW